MKNTIRWGVIVITSVFTLFLYQNCGQEGKIFSDCTEDSCTGDNKDLSLDTSYSDSNLSSGDSLTVGIVQAQENSSSTASYKNIHLSGQCAVGNFARHRIQWQISCAYSSDCASLSLRRGSTHCSGNGYSISEYIRGFAEGSGRYFLKLEIVGLDEFDNPVYGTASAQMQLSLNTVKTIGAPSLFNFATIPGTPITDPILIKDSGFDFKGLCDRANTSDSSYENLIKLKLKVPNTSASLGVASGGQNILCKKISEGESVVQTTATNYSRSGFFNFSFPDILSGSPSPAFSCTNCIPSTFSRLLYVEASQTDDVSSVLIPVSSQQLYLFKSNNLYKGKGWTAETLYEISVRVKNMLSFSSPSENTLSDSDLNFISQIIYPLPTTLDAMDDATDNNKPETRSIRSFVLNKMNGHGEFGRRFSNTDKTIQAFSSGNDFGTVLKSIVTDLSTCGFSEDSDPILGVNADLESERLALCLTRFFYYGLHKDSIENTRKITSVGLNVGSSTCKFKDNADASPKYCAKVKELLLNQSFGVSGYDIPEIINPNVLNYNLPGIKQKFLSGGNISNMSISNKNFEFYTNAVVQLITNSIMAEISRHTNSGITNSYFIQNVLDSVYGSFIPTSFTTSQKMNLYSQMAPNEVNYISGSNNFSAYTSQTSRGSINSIGSITCVVTTDSSGTICKNP